MVSRPSNHVTQAIDAFTSGHDKTPQLPVLERTQVERLEALYPPKCLGRTDTVEDHLRYAGQVELIASLRRRFEQAKEEKGTDEGDDLSGAERAS